MEEIDPWTDTLDARVWVFRLERALGNRVMCYQGGDVVTVDQRKRRHAAGD